MVHHRKPRLLGSLVPGSKIKGSGNGQISKEKKKIMNIIEQNNIFHFMISGGPVFAH